MKRADSEKLCGGHCTQLGNYVEWRIKWRIKRKAKEMEGRK